MLQREVSDTSDPIKDLNDPRVVVLIINTEELLQNDSSSMTLALALL